MAIQFTPLQLDALSEVFNIGVGHAASALSELLHDSVLLNIPELRIVSRDEAGQLLVPNLNQKVCAVSQAFSGSFVGEALVMFPEENSLELVRLMIGKPMPLSYLTELEQDALTEIGNIILNACISTLSDVFGEAIQCDPPVLHLGSGRDLLDRPDKKQSREILMLQIAFSLEKREVKGFLAFLLDTSSLDGLRTGLDRFLTGALHRAG